MSAPEAAVTLLPRVVSESLSTEAYLRYIFQSGVIIRARNTACSTQLKLDVPPNVAGNTTFSDLLLFARPSLPTHFTRSASPPTYTDGQRPTLS